MPGASHEQLVVFQCPSGHIYFVDHDRCGHCQGALKVSKHPARAVLVSQTTVRVNPTGSPYRLGIAEITGGARTLCVVEQSVPDGDAVPVVLQVRDGLYHAVIVAESKTG